jgi:NTE family protein
MNDLEIKNLENELEHILSAKSNNPLYQNKNKEKNILILSGGSIKGISHLGATNALEDLGYLNKIETIAGTSAGAFLAGMLAIGWKSKELFYFTSLFSFEKTKNINIFDLPTKFGLDDGSSIEYLIKRLVKYKNLSENITLEEVYKKFNKKLVIVATCLNTNEIEYFTPETHPDLSLVTAIRMSISMPLYYHPVSYNNNLYVDGGCMDNYPISYFQDKLENVIGILIIDSTKPSPIINNLETFTLKVWKSIMKGIEQNILKNYSESTIIIKISDINILDYDINKTEKEKIYKIGYDSVCNFFN